MKNFVLFAFMTTLLAGASYGAFYAFNKQKAAESTPLRTEMRYSRLANGATVIEEVPASAIEDLEPAAGTETQPLPMRFIYDPLTQTYRAQSGVDSSENSRQDIIRYPSNP
ncbi:MAG: hypothetical protein EBQ96_04495 [Proteobacteria bacterium]|nr:hypothetical protein [Pseudomonadota bacterium]